MTRQVQDRQGRLIKPLHAILFVAALLVFIFTVVYRMVKSESFSTAMAILVESLLIVSFVIFIGIFSAYLIYFMRERVLKASRRLPPRDMFADHFDRDGSPCEPDLNSMGLKAGDEVKSQSHS